PLKWMSDENFDYAEGTFGHHEGERWGKDRVAGFIQTRRILFVKPSYFIVLDTIQPPDSATHTYESIFHLDAADAKVAAATAKVMIADPQRASLTILALNT